MRLKPDDGRLTGQQIGQFQAAILNSYDLDGLDTMLRFQVNIHREHIALGNNLGIIVLRVIERAEDESWTAELLLGTRASRPKNAMLLAFAQQFDLATDNTPPRLELERLVDETNSFLDVVGWRERLAELETRICRIEYPEANGKGTGFLLGPDVVMTNYHVMKPIIDGQVSPYDVILRFDYKTRSMNGSPYQLHDPDWCIDYSPFSPLDEQAGSENADRDPDQLDYALLRLSEAAGSSPVPTGASGQISPSASTEGGGADPNAPRRGWIEVPATFHKFKADTSLFILQHPLGSRLKLALNTKAIIGLNGNGTRVRYRTNTDSGSSGSPCFNANWELVALHHLGDPGYQLLAKYNQGVPLATILARLERVGLRNALGEQQL